MNNDVNKILLASKSPRRRELLKQLISEFSVCSTNADESIGQTSPKEMVIELSKRKAQSVQFDGLVIASDTLVFDNQIALGKPSDEQHAFEMLKQLSGKVHQVYSGVCLKTKDKTVTFAVKTDVKFKNLTDKDIWFYIQNFQPLDKAGAYGIQDGYCVESINGSYTNVMGLPLEQLKIELIKLGVKVKE